MKGAFLTTLKNDVISKDSPVGVGAKVYRQIQTLQKIEPGTDIEIYSNDELVPKDLLHKVERRLPITLSKPDINLIECLSKKDFLYIRKPFYLDGYFIRILEDVKSENPEIAILMEVPTYPYDDELRYKKGLKIRTLIASDRRERIKLKNYVNRMVTYSKDSEIWGIPTINIANAVDFDRTCRKHYMQSLPQTIELIAVANLSFWHGYDRALQGLADYYHGGSDTYNYMLHIVGDGAELPRYEQFVRDNKLEEHVILHGELRGDALDDIYDRCIIGLDSMGRHRSGVYYNSSLKGKEYLAEGLIVVSGVTTELDDDPNYPYYMRIPADESPMDYVALSAFLNKLLRDYTIESIQKAIVDYARAHYDYPVVMREVFEYIEGRKEESFMAEENINKVSNSMIGGVIYDYLIIVRRFACLIDGRTQILEFNGARAAGHSMEYGGLCA